MSGFVLLLRGWTLLLWWHLSLIFSHILTFLDFHFLFYFITIQLNTLLFFHLVIIIVSNLSLKLTCINLSFPMAQFSPTVSYQSYPKAQNIQPNLLFSHFMCCFVVVCCYELRLPWQIMIFFVSFIDRLTCWQKRTFFPSSILQISYSNNKEPSQHTTSKSHHNIQSTRIFPISMPTQTHEI